MRWLIRLAVLALAAFGAKTLYDRWYGDRPTNTEMLVEPVPYVESIRTEIEEVVAAPYDPELGIPLET